MSGHSAQSVFPLQPALQPLSHLLQILLHWLRTTLTHSLTQSLWFCLCLFGLLSVIVYSKWDSQTIYHCHHVTAAKPPFSPQTEDFWQLCLSTEMQSSRLSAAFQISQDSVWAVNRNFRIENQVIPPYHKPKLSFTY